MGKHPQCQCHQIASKIESTLEIYLIPSVIVASRIARPMTYLLTILYV